MPSYRRLPSGLWQATVYMPNGKRITETDKLKTVVKDWATEQEARFRRGDHRDPRAGQVRVRDWHERRAGARVLDTPTGKKNASLWRTHCEDRWGDWPLESITRMDAQEWVNELIETRRARHRGKPVTDTDDDEVPFLSAATIHDVVHLMTGDYKAAMKEHPPIVLFNPFADLELPRRNASALEFYERDEAAALYEAVEDLHGPHWRALVELNMDVGLRPGEAYGLHKDRTDWGRHQISVTRVMTRDGLREYAKSLMSHRTVPVPIPTLDRIAGHLGAGRRWSGVCTCPKVGGRGGSEPCKGLVFPAPGGGPLDDGNFRDRIWYPAVQAAGIRRFPPRITRHTAASWLVQDGVPLYHVQALLGHEDYATTQRYAHLAPDAHEKVRESWQRRAGEQN